MCPQQCVLVCQYLKGQLVGAGKKFEEKIRAKKSQELLIFLRPNFFLARSDFSLPPLTAPVSEWMWRGPVQSPCKARADQWIWQGFLGRDETSCVRLATNNILSQVLLSTFFSYFKLKLRKSPLIRYFGLVILSV